ncbi:hypothetical protein ACRTC3_16585 [Photobacterium damselae]|uniref:hypothetical protein n=1 Tax=Photobacterium damselae TaxID=38293 RepID=UPI003D7DE122
MAITLTQLRGLVTPEGVSDSLDNQIYNSLSFNDIKNVSTACRSAANWCYAYLGRYDALKINYSDDDKQVLSEAMTQMAIYELFLISDIYDEERKEQAVGMLNALIGLPDSDGNGDGLPIIGAARSCDYDSHIKHTCRSTRKCGPSY